MRRTLVNPSSPGRASRRLVMITVLLALSVAGTWLLLLFPLVLDRATPGGGLDWERLSFIGQTYGAASAILSVLALIAVAASLYLQAREMATTREQSLRVLHVDLLRIALDDPLYMDCWGSFSSAAEQDAQRQHVYVNMIVSHWQTTYEIRGMDDTQLRAITESLFTGVPARRFWRDAREARLRTATSQRVQRFTTIVDESYQAALRQHPAPPEPTARVTAPAPTPVALPAELTSSRGFAPRRNAALAERLSLLSTGAAVGLAGAFLRRRRRQES